MLCERKRCGHELGLHDPCSVKGCKCKGFLPVERKRMAATITDMTLGRDTEIAALRTRGKR